MATANRIGWAKNGRGSGRGPEKNAIDENSRAVKSGSNKVADRASHYPKISLVLAGSLRRSHESESNEQGFRPPALVASMDH